MKFPAILPPSDLLDQVSGIEDGLLKQNRLGRLGKLGVLVAAAQALLVVVRSDLWTTLTEARWHDLFFGEEGQSGLLDKWPFLLAVAVLLVAVFFIAWKRFWLKESAAPFRYTYEISDFEPLTETDGRFRWLRHDLADLLNDRIGRLSILEKDESGAGADDQTDRSKGQLGQRAAPPTTFDSHIMIRGHYGVRVEEGNDPGVFMEVFPRVRIGDRGAPETLAHRVSFLLGESRNNPSDTGAAIGSETRALTPEEYKKVLERVYFSVATEIYKQIRSDVQHKIALLPTQYLRARAYFYEAEDYARSNTLDAYDEAQKLYDAAIAYCVPGRQPRPKGFVRRVAAFLRRRAAAVRWGLRVAGSRIWNGAAKAELMVARAEMGLANVLVFRRMLASASGRVINPMFEARPMAIEAVGRLRRLPKDVPGVREALFDAHVTAAITWALLGSPRKAKESLLEARRLLPSRPENDARFLYASSLVESSPRSEMLLLERAVELEPEFEAAQFGLAVRAEMMWRARPGLETSVADAVLKEYGLVLGLNPGNLAAWANRGYIRWLLIETEPAKKQVETAEARKEFARGREYKSLKRETYVAELDYGLARIAAETGDFLGAYNHFTEAATAYFAQGLSQGSTNTWSAFSAYFFQYIDRLMLARFRRYKEDVETFYWAAHFGNKGSALHNSVMAFVQTDYGEACFSYYKRSKDRSYAIEAKEAYEKALQLDPSYAIPLYDLYALAQEAAVDASDTTEPVNPETFTERLNDVEPEWLETKLAIISLRATQAARADDAGHRARREAGEAERKGRHETTEAKRLKPEENKYEVEGLQAAPYEPENATKGWEGDATNSINRALALEADAGELFQRRDSHQSQVDEILHILLPHDWLWHRRRARVDSPSTDGGPALRMKVFQKRGVLRRRTRFGRELKWEREFNDLHVVALYRGGQAHVARTRQKTSEASRILAHVEDRFWPDNVNILQFFRMAVDERLGALRPRNTGPAGETPERRALFGRLSWPARIWPALDSELRLLRMLDKYNRILRDAIESSLATDPLGWWALSWLDDSYIADVRALGETIPLICMTLGVERQIQFLQQALLEKTEASAAPYWWVGDRMKTLITEVEAEPGRQPGEIITRCAEALERGEIAQASTELGMLAFRRLDASSLSRLRLAMRSSVESVKRLGGDLRKAEADLSERLVELRKSMITAYERALTGESDPLVIGSIVESLKGLEQRDEVIAALERVLKARQDREHTTRGRPYPSRTREGRHELISEWPIVEAMVEMVPRERALHLIDRFALGSAAFDADLLWSLGNAYAHLERWAQSLEAYERSREANARRPPEARIHSQDEYRLIVAQPHWCLGHRNKALASLSTISPKEEELSPGWRTTLVETLGEADQLSSRAGYLQLRAWLEWQQQLDGLMKEGARRDAGRALLALARMSRSHPTYGWGTPEPFEDDPKMHPVVVPIILVAHEGMFPQLGDTPAVDTMINKYIPATQEAILRETGVRVPGVRIRASKRAELQHGDYVIRLHELTAESGNVAGDEDPYLRMVAHGVEPMVRRYLDTFVGVQETEEMLQSSVSEPNGRGAADESPEPILSNSKERLRLVQALQRLLRQKVPIVRVGDIVDAFEQGRREGESLFDLVERLRLVLKDDLPGRDERRSLVHVGGWEESISEWIVRDNGSAFLALDAGEEQQLEALLSAVREIVGEDGKLPVALVLEDPTLRPFVQQAIEGRFADVAVVSESELADSAWTMARLASAGTLMERSS